MFYVFWQFRNFRLKKCGHSKMPGLMSWGFSVVIISAQTRTCGLVLVVSPTPRVQVLQNRIEWSQMVLLRFETLPAQDCHWHIPKEKKGKECIPCSNVITCVSAHDLLSTTQNGQLASESCCNTGESVRMRVAMFTCLDLQWFLYNFRTSKHSTSSFKYEI